MNVLGAFIQQQMDMRRWRQVDLVRRSGLPKQVVSVLLNEQPQRRMISDTTIRGLAVAFGLDRVEDRTVTERAQILDEWERAIRIKASEAIGVPVGEVVQIPRPLTEDEVVELVRAGFRALQSEPQPATNPTVGNGGDKTDSGEPGTLGDLRDPWRSHGSDATLDDSYQNRHAV